MNTSNLTYRSLDTSLAILILRVMFGGLFMYYGYIKVAGYDQILPIFPDLIGIGSKLSYNLVIFAELFCGFLVFIGLFTRLAIIPILISMIVVFFIAHAKDPFPVKQIALVHLVLCVVIFILGSGWYSADRLAFGRSER
jgi:putative oxidoreductase